MCMQGRREQSQRFGPNFSGQYKASYDNGEGICQPTGGLLLATLIIASGRSEDLTSLLEEGGLESLVKHVREPAEPTYGTS